MAATKRSTRPTAERLKAPLAVAEQATGHKFSDRELLRRALTHPSAVEDRDPDAYYERLEFLGDSILGFIVAEEIYRRFPDMPEGGMTRIRGSVVAGTVLGRVAADLGLADAIVFGESERGTGGRGMSSATGGHSHGGSRGSGRCCRRRRPSTRRSGSPATRRTRLCRR